MEDESSLNLELPIQFDNKRLDPWFVTGFTDAGGSFLIGLSENKELVSGYRTRFTFCINLHTKDLLKSIQLYFGGKGTFYFYKDKKAVQYRINTSEDLKIVIDHFDQYPLCTQKKADYLLFKQAFFLYKDHRLTKEILDQIVAIKASVNRGLSEKLKNSFSDIIPVPRPSILNEKVPHPYWLSGFVSGDGSFGLNISKSTTHKLGWKVTLLFTIGQDKRESCASKRSLEEEFMKNLANYLSCGYWTDSQSQSYGQFVVTKFSDIGNIIIPFCAPIPYKVRDSLRWAKLKLGSLRRALSEGRRFLWI